MDNKFAKRMTALRKDHGWSQKKAAEKLGISQALLSHYEKGIRECGLNFIIKAANVYSVSADYLLGITKFKNQTNTEQDIDYINADLQELPKLQLGRNQIIQSLNILYSITARIGNSKIQTDFNNLWYSQIYKTARILDSSLSNTLSDIFILPTLQGILNSKSIEDQAILNLNRTITSMKIDQSITKKMLKKEYPNNAKSLLLVVETIEDIAKKAEK